MSNLTVLLPLKGRALFTLRFLWHANEARLPYKFVIADGSEEKFAQISCSHLDIDYIKFPPDRTLNNYYLKMSLALERVETPYVMFADNDDFLIGSGIDYCTRFLDAHPDYVSVGGRVAGFSVRGDVAGSVNKWSLLYSPRDAPIDLDDNHADDRVKRGMRGTWIYYAVHRTAVMRRLFGEVLDLSPSHLGCAERFLAAKLLTLGKAKCEAGIFSYARQYWTSLGDHGAQDFLQIAGDLQAISRRIPAAGDGLREWYADISRSTYGTHAIARAAIPLDLRRWLKRRFRPAVRFERKSMVAAGLEQKELRLIETALDSRRWRPVRGRAGQHHWRSLSGEPVCL